MRPALAAAHADRCAPQDIVVPLESSDATDASRFGPKASNLAILGRAGLPIPRGFCLDAQAYRLQLAALGLDETARDVDPRQIPQQRRRVLAIRLSLLDQPILASVLEPLLQGRRALLEEAAAPLVVRSSALVEDRFGSSFAGQFESYLGLESAEDFITAVRSCWAALWSPRVMRYMAGCDASPADTAMGVLVQPLVSARASGGGLSQSGDEGMVLTATWGLGSAIAQGEVVPDRIVLGRDLTLQSSVAGRKYHSVGCAHGSRALPRSLFSAACLDAAQAQELGRILHRVEEVLGMPVEIEWALDDTGFKLLQARPLHVAAPQARDKIWLHHARLNGQPAGIGWSSGRACVVSCECELARVGPGDILVTRVAGPALASVLPWVAGVVAELGGSTSHLASLARERGIPMVLGVLEATRRIPDGVEVAVDGVTGVVQWMR